MQYIWAIDTPWAKKGEPAVLAEFDETKIKVNAASFASIETLHSLGWIKPVEDNVTEIDNIKKLTEEEILEAITNYFVVGSAGTRSLSLEKLAKFLAEHLK